MAQYPEGINEMHHIAYDIRKGIFPKRSSVEEFLAAGAPRRTAVDIYGAVRSKLANNIVETFSGMTFDEPEHAKEWLRTAIMAALAAREEEVRRDAW